MIYQRGALIGSEFRAKGAEVALGPVCGPLGRVARGGRNWEGFSPDSYLTGVAVGETVSGIQSTGVQATTKHYILNEQETQRNPSTVNGTAIDAFSSNIDDKTMHETYLWPFANAVHAGTASIMCSYNRINGSYGCQNSKTLNGLLKTELGFQGYVMSDWAATHAGIATIEAGLDMNMPGGIDFLTPTPSLWGANLTAAVNNGSLSVTRLDDAVLRVLTPYFYLKQDEGYPLVDESAAPLNFFATSSYLYNFTLGPIVDARDDHGDFIRELGAQSIVLLKNENQTLPLKNPKNIGIFGNAAGEPDYGMYLITLDAADVPLVGPMASGGGSGEGRLTYVIPPLEAIKERAGYKKNALVQYILDYDRIVTSGLSSLAPSPPDVCLVFLKAFAGEGFDRQSLEADQNGTAVVNTVAASCPNTVVVLTGTGPIVVPFASNPNVTAILHAHFPGQEIGNSITDVLYGDVNPSGRLPYTVAAEKDYPDTLLNSTALVTSLNPDAWELNFTEGNFIDYKYFDKTNTSVVYPFGFGLSYTTFSVSNLVVPSTYQKISRTPSASAKIIPGGNEQLWETVATIQATVTNTGSIAGKAVPQLYVSLGSEAGKNNPVRQLRGFEKVLLQPGESKVVSFELQRRDVSYWDIVKQTWVIPSSGICVSVGTSSRDLPLTASLTI